MRPRHCRLRMAPPTLPLTRHEPLSLRSAASLRGLQYTYLNVQPLGTVEMELDAIPGPMCDGSGVCSFRNVRLHVLLDGSFREVDDQVLPNSAARVMPQLCRSIPLE